MPSSTTETGSSLYSTSPRVAALAVTFREEEVALVQRGNEPERFSWGFPGGSVNLGENLKDAAIRELKEETGLIASPLRSLPVIEYIGTDGTGMRHHFILVPILCLYTSGELYAMDDVIDSRWIHFNKIEDLHIPIVDGVIDTARYGANQLNIGKE